MGGEDDRAGLVFFGFALGLAAAGAFFFGAAFGLGSLATLGFLATEPPSALSSAVLRFCNFRQHHLIVKDVL
jgi:hypothetical protein